MLTLDQYKTLAKIDPSDDREDEILDILIPAAKRAVENHTDRNFSALTLSEMREYFDDGSGYLDVDDCVDVTAVSVVYPDTTAAVDSWSARPYRNDVSSPPHHYLVLGNGPRRSHAMGFERNLDTIPEVPYSRLIAVTARWGWPAVPEDVLLATFWTVEAAAKRPASPDLTSEAIAGFSRSWGGPSAPSLAVPSRARDILAPYTRISV